MISRNVSRGDYSYTMNWVRWCSLCFYLSTLLYQMPNMHTPKSNPKKIQVKPWDEISDGAQWVGLPTAAYLGSPDAYNLHVHSVSH